MDGHRTVDQLWREARRPSRRGGAEAGRADPACWRSSMPRTCCRRKRPPDSDELLHARREGRAILVAEQTFSTRWRCACGSGIRTISSSAGCRTSNGWSAAAGWLLWLVVVLPAVVLAAQHWPELSANASRPRPRGRQSVADGAELFRCSRRCTSSGTATRVKAFGGPVHEIGVMFLVFAPVPYVDASAASEFRSKWRRAVVGAAGMIVEVFLAALALYVWLAVEDGLVRALAYNVMLIAGVSTVRLQRQSAAALRRLLYPLRSAGDPEPVATGDPILGLPDRAACLPDAGREGILRHAGRADLALPLCAGVVLLSRRGDAAIALFIASEYLAVGVAIGIWGICTGVAAAHRQGACAGDLRVRVSSATGRAR